MDQKKIGKYIADKRKTLGLTQLQLAEKLNMSDKSVSKWERGVCLPDVSVYTKLCDTLGISLNEFLAGEDLTEKEIISKSEETIINIATDSKKSRQRGNLLIVLVIVAALLFFAMFIGFLNEELDEDQDGFFDKGIVLLPENSAEALMVNRFESGNVNLYRYTTNEIYDHMQIKSYWYKDGKLTDENVLQRYSFTGEHTGEGLIALVDDHDSGSIGFEVALEGDDRENIIKEEFRSKLELPFEEYDLSMWQETYNRSIYIPENKMEADWPSLETGIFVMAFDENPALEITSTLENTGFWTKARKYCPEIAEYDYAVYVTVKFWN